MKTTKTIYTLLLLSVLTCVATAQPGLQSYVQQSEPYVLALQNTVQEFLGEMKPLREKRDIAGLKKVADKYLLTWNGYASELNKLSPPPEAKTYHDSLTRLHQLQGESSQIMSEVMGHRLEVLKYARQMKEGGRTEEDIQAYIKSNEIDRENLVARTSAITSETASANASMNSERKKIIGQLKASTDTK